jgi:hypothetical protein
MSTFRPATRRIHTRRFRGSPYRPEPIPARKFHAGVEPRLFLAAAILCAAIFAGSFVVGREGRTTSSHREAGPSAVPLVSAGSPIPVHLSSAPPIQIEAAAAPAPNAVAAGKGTTRHAIARAPLAESRAIVAPVPATSPPPPAAVSPQPAPEAPAASPQQPSAPSASPPAATHGSSSGSAPASETGKSFDTSG